MQQLAGRDAIFLAMETPEVHAHTGGLVLLDPTGVPDFGFEKVKRLVDERIRLVPKFTWKLKEVPLGLDRPYWIEDPDFDVAYHMHRIGVPSPGGMREVAELCGDLFSHKIDRRRPLWEMWYIEGLEKGRVALFAKTHHCMIDGISGAGLAELLCDLQRDPPPRVSGPRKRRPKRERVPGDWELVLWSLGSVLGTPFGLLRYAAQALRRGVALLEYLRQDDAPPLLRGVPRLSFNDVIGPKRAFASSSVPLAGVQKMKKHFGVKVNDVILELCGSAVRRYLLAHGELPQDSLVVGCAVSTRDVGDTELGNRIATMNVGWATDVADPGERVVQIHRNTQKSKEMTRAIRARRIQAMGDTAPPALINLAFRAMTATTALPLPNNVLVSNVPGPPFPLYSAGARIEALYPMSLLTSGMGLNITVVSYESRVDFGFTVDPDLIPDPWFLAEGIPIAVQELEEAARRPRPAPAEAQAEPAAAEQSQAS